MQKLFYDTLKPFYGNKVRLADTDTNSFILEIETDDVYEDFLQPELKDYMDFNDYAEIINVLIKLIKKIRKVQR